MVGIEDKLCHVGVTVAANSCGYGGITSVIGDDLLNLSAMAACVMGGVSFPQLATCTCP